MLITLKQVGLISDLDEVKLFGPDNLKRTQYYQNQKLLNLAQRGHLSCMPPEFGGPPLAGPRSNMN